MKLRLRRQTVAMPNSSQADSTPDEPQPLVPGTRLGGFNESGLRIEVQLAGEQRLWLQRSSSGGTTDIGPIAWDDHRTPSLEPVPFWLKANSWATTALVLKAAALHRAVILGEPLDPTLGIEVNSELGDLVYQVEARP